MMTFIGSSPIRRFAENWDAERISMSAERLPATQNNLPCTYVTEDTVRSPEMLASLFKKMRSTSRAAFVTV